MTMDLEPRDGESLDRLNARLRLLQRVRGHRATSDDVLLAWAAVAARPQARRYLDLGTGKGTVALLVLDALPDCEAEGLEAVAESHALALRNARLNGLDGRFRPHLADLRAPEALPAGARFDLIGGAPPYVPAGAGVLPADPQRAAGRHELRGGVEEYARAAARWLAPDGAAVLLVDGAGRDRAAVALVAAGLRARRRIEVGAHPGRPATFWIFVAGYSDGPLATERLDLRSAPGSAWSPAYAGARAALALDGDAIPRPSG
jgi:tRNA1(Val) A37 N6-methylase TrmN6